MIFWEEINFLLSIIKKPRTKVRGNLFRAEDEARTRDNQLGRLELYQLSYFRITKPE
jgi:hypothetical protein